MLSIVKNYATKGKKLPTSLFFYTFPVLSDKTICIYLQAQLKLLTIAGACTVKYAVKINRRCSGRALIRNRFVC
jgi:hypothetical protein